MALSHCWGVSHQFTTTKATLRSHMDSIPLCELPKAFQQAVDIPRALEVPYLWIDSLCITQDDTLDWETEASKMGDVYRAYLTISALGSADDPGAVWKMAS
jgi:Heterokaryon incompatibility protein (HET)